MEKGLNLREQMPNVARLVDEQRETLGKAYVNECIRAAVAGKPDKFYAFEAGHVLGTPFTRDTVLHEAVRCCVALGGSYAMVIARPIEEGVPRGTH